MAELKRMCDDHFHKREEDDAKIKDLEGRIAETRKKREESKAIRLAKEAEKNEKLEALKAQHAKEEAEKVASQKARQAEILAGEIFKISNFKISKFQKIQKIQNIKPWPVDMTKRLLEHGVVKNVD